MPCNCGKKKNSSFVYVSATGQQTTYNTEVEAKAAKIRAGGTGEVKVVTR
jgi:hypothetical protein